MATGRLYQNEGCYDFVNTTQATIASGQIVVNGNVFGCAIRAIKPGATGAIQTNGIWELPIASATTATIGALAYWDATNAVVTATASTNLQIGYFVKASASGETTCTVALTQTGIKAAQ